MAGFWPQEPLWPDSEDAGFCPKQALLLSCSTFLSSLHWKAERGPELLQLSRLSHRNQRILNTTDFWFGYILSALLFSMTSWILTKHWHKTYFIYRWTWFSNSGDVSTFNMQKSTLIARKYYFTFILFNSPWMRKKTAHCFVPCNITGAFFLDKEQRQPLVLSVRMAFICFKKMLQSKEDHCSIEQIALWWQIFFIYFSRCTLVTSISVNAHC